MASISAIEIPIGESGVQYLDRFLRKAGGLCSLLRRQIFREGSVSAIVPEGTSLERATRFESGGLMQAVFAGDWLEREFESLCQRYPAGVLVIQDVWTKPEDVGNMAAESRNFVVQDVVYYFSCCADAGKSRATSLLRSTLGFDVGGVFAKSCHRTLKTMAEKVDENILRDLADNAEAIYASAYDQEGLVVWRRN